MSSARSGRVVFDSEALSRAVRGDAYIRGVIEDAYARRELIVVPAPVIVEAIGPKTDRAALSWQLSRLEIVPITKELAIAASDLLVAARLHGHQHAIDAMVCAAALALGSPKPVLYTSDPGDYRLLAGDRLVVIPLH